MVYLCAGIFRRGFSDAPPRLRRASRYLRNHQVRLDRAEVREFLLAAQTTTERRQRQGRRSRTSRDCQHLPLFWTWVSLFQIWASRQAVSSTCTRGSIRFLHFCASPCVTATASAKGV